MAPPDPFDASALRLPDSLAQTVLQTPKRPPRHQPREHFLKGPIPWSWLNAALKLPGRSLHVALLLWKECGCKRRRTVALNVQRAAGVLGVDTTTTRAGLRALEGAKLVTIRLRPGRPLEVTINEAPTQELCNTVEPPAL
jgi:hypothetical protein